MKPALKKASSLLFTLDNSDYRFESRPIPVIHNIAAPARILSPAFVLVEEDFKLEVQLQEHPYFVHGWALLEPTTQYLVHATTNFSFSLSNIFSGLEQI